MKIDEYHKALFDLYVVVKCLKLEKNIFEESGVEINDFVKVMENANRILKDENWN